jgi:hypothetical protein
MFARVFGDLKYLLMLVLTAAGIGVPVWLWFADQTAKSVSVQLVSQVPLYPNNRDAVVGLQITIDGVSLIDPYLSVLKIVNEGGKPVATADFEAPLTGC